MSDDLRAALDRLTDAEARHVLHALATRYPEDAAELGAYVHERRVWYPHPGGEQR